MTETLNDNRFVRLGCECVYDHEDIVVYKAQQNCDVDILTGTGWCPVEHLEQGVINYRGPLYAIVKILPNGIKIKGGMDVGFGTLRYVNDKTMSMKHAKQYVGVIDNVYTDDVLLDIQPKTKNGEPVLPDMWLLRHVNDRVHAVMSKNKHVIQLLYKQKFAIKRSEN